MNPAVQPFVFAAAGAFGAWCSWFFYWTQLSHSLMLKDVNHARKHVAWDETGVDTYRIYLSASPEVMSQSSVSKN